MAVFRCDDTIAENSLARAAKSSNKLLHSVECVILNYEVFFSQIGEEFFIASWLSWYRQHFPIMELAEFDTLEYFGLDSKFFKPKS
jgi:hypothetical protein